MATDKVAYWLDIADYDLDTAEAMYQTGRWLYVAFMCNQTIEKTIKAYWCGTQTTDPLLMKLRNYNKTNRYQLWWRFFLDYSPIRWEYFQII